MLGWWWEPRKYQFMEQNLQRRVVGLKDKLPDIKKTLDTVRFLKLRTVWRRRTFLAVDEANVGLCGRPSRIRSRRRLS